MDETERLCQKRALEAFNLDGTVWSVNVQCEYSVFNKGLACDPAHYALAEIAHSRELSCLQACSAILRPYDRLLILEPTGGYFLSKYFATYKFNENSNSSHITNCQELEHAVHSFKPRLVLVNAPASKLQIDHAAIRRIYRLAGTYIVVDVTKIAGLIICGLAASPFEHTDIVIVGMRGSMRGPSEALIFSRKKRVSASDRR